MIMIEIKRGKRNVKRRNFHLQNKGFEYKKTGKYTGKWVLKTDNEDITDIKRYCKRKGYEIHSWNTDNSRASNCRKIYFDNNEPKLFGRYMCVYCSRLLNEKNVAVDHLISVKLVQTKKSYLRRIKYFKMDSVNDPKNLVSSCQHCNLKKGKKGGTWIIRGMLGKNLFYWFVVYCLRIAAVSYLVYYSLPLLQQYFNLLDNFN